MAPEKREGVNREQAQFELRGVVRPTVFGMVLVLFFSGVALLPHAAGRSLATFVVLYGAVTLLWVGLAVWSPIIPPSAIVATAVVLRTFFLPATPLLSNDVYRYLWDGNVSATGRNPYLLPPNDPALAHLRRPWSSRINHPGLRTVYPPVSQLLFRVNTALSRGLISWKALLLLIETAVVLALLALRFRTAAFAYASCPLLLVESAWSGHVDTIGGALLLAAVILARRGRSVAGGLALAAATGVKIIPAVSLISLLRSGGWRLAVSFALGIGVPVLLFLYGGGLMPGFGEYAVRWSFNSPLFELTRNLIEYSRGDELAKKVWSATKDPLHLELISSMVYAQFHPDRLARIVLGLAFTILLFRTSRGSGSEAAGATRAVGLLLLFSPTIHPWYWIALLPLALFEIQPVWIVLAVSAPASYLFYQSESAHALVYVLCYGPAGIVLLAEKMRANPRFARS